MADHNDNGSSRSRTTVIVVGIVGGVIAVCLLCCGGPVYLAFRETAQSQRVANDFLENIRAGHLDWAYESTTEMFKKKMTRKAFDELIQKNELQQPDIFPLNQGPHLPPAQVFSGPYNYDYRIPAKEGKEPLEFHITVAKENGVLKVGGITLHKKEGTK
jgi:hypothetical protein